MSEAPSGPLGLIVFCLLLGVAAGWDMRSWRIPNLLCAVVAMSALILAWPPDMAAWGARLSSVAVVGVTVLALYMVGGMGGGDVKLLAAVALWMPFQTLPPFVLALGLIGGVQAVVTLVTRRLSPVAANGASAPPRRRMPYGVSIALAGWAWALFVWRASA